MSTSDEGWAGQFPSAAEPTDRTSPLGDTEGGYLVVDGPADIFAIRNTIDGVRARRHFVARIPARGFVPAMSGLGALRFVVVPLPGARLRAVGPEIRTHRGADAAVAQALDTGLLAIADSIRDGQRPRDAVPLRPTQILSLAPGTAITGNHALWWVRTLGGGVLRNDGGAGQVSEDGDLALLAGRDWIVASSACTVVSLSTTELIEQGLLWDAVDRQMTRVRRIVEGRIEAAEAQFEQRLRERKRANAAIVASAARVSIGVLGVSAPPVLAEHARFERYRRAAAVLRVLTEGTGATIVEPTNGYRAPDSEREAVQDAARSSALHLREVRLPPQWWSQDLGPLIGWRRGETGPRAVALRFHRGRYRAVDPETRVAVAITRASADEFEEAATQAQPPLPREVRMRRALRIAATGSGRDFRAMLTAGVVVATLGLATPIVAGIVLGIIAEHGTADGLVQFALIITAGCSVAATFAVLQNLRFLRLEGRLEIGTQLVLWDRLIRLPVRFFRTGPSGELANAMLGVSFIREALSGLLAQTVTAALTAVADLVLIFVLSPPIGFCALGVVLACLILLGVFGPAVARRQRRALPSEHAAAALTNQLLGGIVKLKLAGAEDRAYSQWAERNATARSELNRVRRVQAILLATATVLPIAAQLMFFALLAGPLAGVVAPRTFFIVNTAFVILVGALLVLLTGSVEVLAALPRLEALAPILAQDPERLPDRVDPGDLRGEITVGNVTFAYNPDEPPVLDDVTIRVAPGEFVAVVGPSGSGKSTLLRLLLGFERPRSGVVLYDGQDLGELDLQAVRRQCGVVLQDGLLFSGSIRDNIVGAGNYSLDQVWEAARMAGLDEDIGNFPMGMATMVPHGGGTLSVGQRQRVLVARALIHRPRAVFFDEATSALDNRTQDIVAASTQELAATRLIIAHRLSTVISADRIIVLDRGRVVQEGTFTELMAEPDGLFHRLAVRQLLTRAATVPA